MKKSTLISLVAVAAIPAMAQNQSLSILVPHVYTQDYNLGGSADLATGNPTDLGLRYAHTLTTLPKLGGARIDFEATVVNACSKPAVTIMGEKLGTYTYEYMALGASSTWTRVLDFGFAAELRHETSSTQVSASPVSMKASTTRYRPWATARVGYTCPRASAIRPFIALEYSLPIITTGSRNITNEYQLYSLMYGGLQGPKAQLTFTLGGRF
nr:hypothetical protein [uncultured Holophaga sp.]